jgi:hypothetical protein
MTGLGVGRTPRTPYQAPYMSSSDASAPLPPHSQEAERPTERPARRTGYGRWGLRVLVVGGLAGAAWLLTGATAQAADRADVPAGSLLGSVSDGSVGSIVGGSLLDNSLVDDTTAPVHGVLKAATQPLEAARPAAKHHIVDDVLDVPRRIIAHPAETIDRVVHGPSGTSVDAAGGGVDQVLRKVAGPLRLTGGPANDQQRLTSVTDAALPRPDSLTTPTALPTPDSQAILVREQPQAPAVSPVRTRLLTPVHHEKTHSVRPPTQDRMAAADAVAGGPETVATENNPGGDGPAAPLRLHLGDVSSTPTSGSGTRTEGGSAAFLPTAIASSTMACHPLPIASDVEVRRHDAEAPTASPD